MDVNWEICVICQSVSSETTRCPQDSKATTTAYETFLNNVEQFREIEALPMPVTYNANSLSLFIDNHACWHKSCHYHQAFR